MGKTLQLLWSGSEFFFEIWTVQDQLGGNWMNVTACLGGELIHCCSVYNADAHL